MSLATRCPACGTIFRVVQDQLKVSEGWVRCGQCHEVFHGIEALFDLDSDPALAARRATRNVPAAPPPARVFGESRVRTGAGGPDLTESLSPPPAPMPEKLPPLRDEAPPIPAIALPGDGTPVPSPAPLAPVPTPAPRAAMAPRFAARLAEEAARAQARLPPSPIPSPYLEEAPSPKPPADAGAGRMEPQWSEPAADAASHDRGEFVVVDAPEAPATRAVFSPAPIPLPLTRETPSVATAAFVDPATAPPAPRAQAPRAPTPADKATSQPIENLALSTASPEPTSAPRTPGELAEDFAAASATTPAPVRQPRTIVPKAPAPAPAPGPAQAVAPVQPPATPLAPAPVPIVVAPQARPPGMSDVLDPKPSTPQQSQAAQAIANIGGSTLPSMLVDDSDEDDRAGPPTLASLLPEDAGEWPPRKKPRMPRARRTPAESRAEAALPRDDPRFLREALRDARWNQPRVRAALAVAAALLAVTAVGQVAWPQRDVLAARWPATLPAWTWACQQAGCTIEAPRAIASLALDGSSLTRTDTDHVLLFSADLHNRADHEVRMPSFDLTFMDLNGVVVARKVLSPAQIGIRQSSLASEAEVHVHARLQVGSLDASGFQAEMFYP